MSNYNGSEEEFNESLVDFTPLFTFIYPYSSSSSYSLHSHSSSSASISISPSFSSLFPSSDRYYLCLSRVSPSSSSLLLSFIAPPLHSYSLSLNYNLFLHHRKQIGIGNKVNWKEVFIMINQTFQKNNNNNKSILFSPIIDKENKENKEKEEEGEEEEEKEEKENEINGIKVLLTYSLGGIDLLGEFDLKRERNEEKKNKNIKDFLFLLYSQYKNPISSSFSSISIEIKEKQKKINELLIENEELKKENEEIKKEKDRLIIEKEKILLMGGGGGIGEIRNNNNENNEEEENKEEKERREREKEKQRMLANRSLLNPTAKRKKPGGFKLG